MANLVRWLTPETGTNWDTTKVYSSTSETGTFTIVETVTLPTVLYWDFDGIATTWYKVAYYDNDESVEGSQSDAFQGIISETAITRTLYTTPSELRSFLQFSATDYPTDEDMFRYLDRAHIQLADDVTGGSIGSTIDNAGRLKLLALLLTSSFVMQGLASRALAKGYVSISLEGVNIAKAHDALMLVSDRYYMKYQEQLAKSTVDYAITSYMDDIGTATVAEIKSIMNGVTDALDYESEWKPSMNNRTGRNSAGG